jgi:CspA family cold shock protein
VTLVINKEKPYIILSGFWPDNRVVSLLTLSGARSDFLTITSTNRVEVALLRAFAHVHLQQSRKVTPMITGTVKFYNDMKGFGFIQPNDGSKDVFVHATALERAGMRNLVEGQKVAFDTAEDRRSGKIAVNNIETA